MQHLLDILKSGGCAINQIFDMAGKNPDRLRMKKIKKVFNDFILDYPQDRKDYAYLEWDKVEKEREDVSLKYQNELRKKHCSMDEVKWCVRFLLKCDVPDEAEDKIALEWCKRNAFKALLTLYYAAEDAFAAYLLQCLEERKERLKEESDDIALVMESRLYIALTQGVGALRDQESDYIQYFFEYIYKHFKSGYRYMDVYYDIFTSGSRSLIGAGGTSKANSRMVKMTYAYIYRCWNKKEKIKEASFGKLEAKKWRLSKLDMWNQFGSTYGLTVKAVDTDDEENLSDVVKQARVYGQALRQKLFKSIQGGHECKDPDPFTMRSMITRILTTESVSKNNQTDASVRHGWRMQDNRTRSFALLYRAYKDEMEKILKQKSNDK